MSASLSTDLTSAEIVAALLAVVPTGVAVLRPLYAPAAPDELVDFAGVHLNEAAQRLLSQPERPADTLRTWLPVAAVVECFRFLRTSFEAGPAGTCEVRGQGAGRAYYLRLTAQRAADLLVVSLSDLTNSAAAAQHSASEQEHAARLAAEAAAERLQLLTESLPSIAFTVDQNGHIPYISPQWYAYTGLTPGQPIEETWPTLLHPDDRPIVTQEYEAALAEGRAWRYEFRLRGAAGGYRWFASQGVPEPPEAAQAAGRPRQWFGSNLDIDALKQAQQLLEQQEQLLTNILSALPAGVVVFEGEDLRYSFFNDTFQDRVQGRAALGRTVADRFPEAEEQGFLTLLRRVLRTGEPYHALEIPTYLRAPGTGAQAARYLDLTYLPLRHGTQPPHAVLGFSVDVTDRVQTRQQAEAAQAALLAAAEQAAAQREAFYQVFEQTPACIAVVRGPEHRFEYANPAYHQLSPGRPLLGRPVAEARPESAAQGFVALLDQVYQTGETYFGQEVRFVMMPSEGQPLHTLYFDFTYQALRERGTITGVSVFASDVTERVRARRVVEEGAQQTRLHAEQLQAANRALTHTNAELDTFIYTASHDLKTPISNIEGLVLALREDLAAPTPQANPTLLLDLMQRDVERFRRTIAHLTDLTKLQQAQQPGPAEPVALAPLVAAVRADLRPQLEATQGQLTVDVAACPTVAFAEKNLRSVVFNLLSNALKYHHPARPARVVLRSYPVPGYCVLEVQDNGLGFDPAQRAKVFGLFKRLHDHVEGSGVGLYVVQKLLDNAGGRIEVDSQPGVGSTFRAYFPASIE